MTNSRRYLLKNYPRLTTDQPTYWQVVRPVTFQDDDTTFSLTVSSVWGDEPYPPAKTSATQAAPELTETATSASKSATPTALQGGNWSLNLTLLTGLEVQEITANTDSDVTSAFSFGTNYNALTFLESNENSPTIKNTTPDLLALIEKTGNIHEVFMGGLEDLHTTRVMFSLDDELDPTELV